METKYSSYSKYLSACVICLFIILGIQSCTKDKDETLPTLNLAYVSYDSKAQTCDFLVTANENAGIKSLEVYKGDSLFYSNTVTDRYQVKNSFEYRAKIKFIKSGFNVRAVVKDFGNNITEKVIEFFPSITIQEPKGSVSWQPNTWQNISWKSNQLNDIRIELYQDNKSYLTIYENYNANTNGSVEWQIPTYLPAGSNYKIRISSINLGFVETFTDNFTILPYIIVNNVINNNGFQVGNVIYLSWVDNISESLRIELFNGVNLIQTISEGTYDTFLRWTIPTNLAPGGNYKIKITKNDGSVNVVSDSFVLTNPIIKFTLPVASSSWLVGTSNSISWENMVATSSIINIELYNDNGIVSTIANGISNNNKYSWTVPTNLSYGNYFIKISDNVYKDKYSLSEKFTISGPSIYSISPSYGASIGFGNIPISWNCNVPIESITIDLYRDGNYKDNIAIINNLEEGTNTYYWKRSTYNTIIKSYSGYSLKFTAFTITGIKLSSTSGTFSLSF